MKRLKRPLALLLVLVMCISLLQLTVLADDITGRTGADSADGETVASASTVQGESGTVARAPGGRAVDDWLLLVEKRVKNPAPSGVYKIGDTIVYEITMTNRGTSVYDITVTDELAGYREDYTTEQKLKRLGYGDSFTDEVRVDITEDILKNVQNGRLVNTVVVQGYIFNDVNVKKAIRQLYR